MKKKQLLDELKDRGPTHKNWNLKINANPKATGVGLHWWASHSCRVNWETMRFSSVRNQEERQRHAAVWQHIVPPRHNMYRKKSYDDLFCYSQAGQCKDTRLNRRGRTLTSTTSWWTCSSRCPSSWSVVNTPEHRHVKTRVQYQDIQVKGNASCNNTIKYSRHWYNVSGCLPFHPEVPTD